MDAPEYDLAVVGLGAMGAAVTWHAQRLGLRVLGLDQSEPPHTLGSTHAETRITRLAVGEGDQYLPFVARSHELWREIESLTGDRLLYETGGYIVSELDSNSDRWTDFTQVTAAIADRADLAYDVLDAAEFRQRQPNVLLPDTMAAGFEPTAGVVMCEDAVRLQLELAQTAGAVLQTGERVDRIEPHDAYVDVITDSGQYRAAKVVVAVGPWTQALAAPAVAERLEVTRQVVFWFEADDPDAWSVERFPFVMWIGSTIDEYCAAFPSPPGTTPGVKILGEQFTHTTSPDQVERSVSAEEIADIHRRLIAPRFVGISDRCVRAEVCLYTNTPDDHFLIERDPRSDRVVVMSPCSGHGFKHSAALGEAVAQQIATGSSNLDLAPFGLPPRAL